MPGDWPMLLVWTSVCILWPGVVWAQPRDVILDQIAIQQRLGEQVPLETAFRDADGRTVTLGECIDARPTVVALVYFECPMLCNMVADGLIRALQAMRLEPGEDFSVVTVSFDPREGPERAAAAKRKTLQRYGRPGAEEAWRFLTGEAESITRLTEAVGFQYTFDEQRKQFAHAAGLTVLTPEGKISRYLLGLDYDPRDLRLALVEASSRQIGSPADSLLLFCYQYDPIAGKYGLAIHRVIQVAGALTVIVLVVAVTSMLRRECAQRRAGSDQGETPVAHLSSTTAGGPAP